MPAYAADGLDILRLNDPCKQYVNLAELYYRPCDPITELVQNSLASILDRQRSAKSPTGSIRVTVDAAAKRLTVEDNGHGFVDLADVAANRSTRNLETTAFSGFGLGISSVLARSDSFFVRSVDSGRMLHEAEWRGVYDLVRSKKAPPAITPVKCRGPQRVSEEPKTAVTISGDEGFQELWRLAAEEPQRLYEVLLAHTALGHTAHIWRSQDRPNCRYQVIIKGGADTLNERGRVGFPFVDVGMADTFHYADYDKSGTIPDPGQLIVLKRTGRRSPLRPYRIKLYVACEVERGRHIPAKFGNYLESLTTNRILLSINGFLQSFPLERPPERMTRALWGNVLAVVDSSDNIVEPGRNRVADKYVHVVHQQLIDAVKCLDRLVTAVRKREKYDHPIAIEDAKKDADANAAATPLSYAVGFKLHVLKEPEDEQEVLVLFGELLGRQVIKGCDILRIGGSASVYDAYLRYRFNYGAVGSRTRPKTDEGRRKLDLGKPRQRTLVGEFKVNVARLVTELRSGQTRKRLRQIDLLVCWDEGPIPTGYSLDLLREDNRFFCCATHQLKKNGGDRSERCEVMLLSEVLERVEARVGS